MFATVVLRCWTLFVRWTVVAHFLAFGLDFHPAAQWLSGHVYVTSPEKSAMQWSSSHRAVVAFCHIVMGTCSSMLWWCWRRDGLKKIAVLDSNHRKRNTAGCCHRAHAVVLATVGYALIAMSAWTAWRHEENWPISSVPMFSQLRDASFVRDCISEQQLEQLSNERHNYIMSFNSWFSLQAVMWRPSPNGEAGGQVELHPIDITAKTRRGQGWPGQALRASIVTNDTRLHVFGGTKRLGDETSAAKIVLRRARVRLKFQCRSIDTCVHFALL